jgi:tetratricopeptide (TPR) repeat protein
LDLLEQLAETTQLYSRWFDYAFELGKQDRNEQAVRAYEKALAIDPNDAVGWTNLGVALSHLGQHEKELVAYEKAILIDPHHAAAWNNKGILMQDLGHYDNALKAFENAIEMAPSYPIAWNNKGNILYHLGKDLEALMTFEKAIALNPNNSVLWSNKGIALRGLGRYEEALTAYEKAISLNPSFAEAYGNKAELLNQLRNHQEALVWITKGRELSQKSEPHLMETYAETLAAIGDWEGAFQMLYDRFIQFPMPRRILRWSCEDFIYVLMLSSMDQSIWKQRIARLIELCIETDALNHLGNGLVQSLRLIPSDLVGQEILTTWLQVWQEVGKPYPEMELPLRLYEVGLRYLRSKEEKVLFDLLQEERRILRDLFRLSEKEEIGKRVH